MPDHRPADAYSPTFVIRLVIGFLVYLLWRYHRNICGELAER
jgi:hypothetical protein